MAMSFRVTLIWRVRKKSRSLDSIKTVMKSCWIVFEFMLGSVDTEHELQGEILPKYMMTSVIRRACCLPVSSLIQNIVILSVTFPRSIFWNLQGIKILSICLCLLRPDRINWPSNFHVAIEVLLMFHDNDGDRHPNLLSFFQKKKRGPSSFGLNIATSLPSRRSTAIVTAVSPPAPQIVKTRTR